MIDLRFFRLDDAGIMPRKAHTGVFEDAAYDLFYCGSEPIDLAPAEHKSFPTGLACVIPEGYWLKFHDRSGLASKKGIQVLAGVIDAGYTGELRVILENTSAVTQRIEPRIAVCQFTVEKIINCRLLFIGDREFTAAIADRDRKDKGFGSSGM